MKPSSAARSLVLLAVLLLSLSALTLGAAGESLGPTWTRTANYPNTTVELQSCVPNADFGRIYCIGGYSGAAYLSTVEYGTISSLGEVGGWSSTKAYPTNAAGQSCFVYEVYIYCVGGYIGAGRTDSVYYAQPNSAGLGVWSTTTSYPFKVQLQSCSVSGTFVYCVGGFDGISYYDTVYYSALLTDGGLGAWSTTTKYPSKIEGQSCVVYSSHIYCIGGYNGSKGTSAVYYATISSTGAVGVWNSTAAYPTSTYGQSCALQNDYVYCVGGYTGSSYTSAAYYGNILSSGGIGGWTATQPYPSGIQNQSCLIISGYIYCMGGFTGDQVTNFVYSDSISAASPTTVTSTTTTTTTFTTSVSNVTVTSTTYVGANQTMTVTSTEVVPTVVISTTTAVRTALSFSATTATVTATLTSTAVSGVTTTVTAESGPVGPQSSPPILLAVSALGGAVLGALVVAAALRKRAKSQAAGTGSSEKPEAEKGQAASRPKSRLKWARYAVYAWSLCS